MEIPDSLFREARATASREGTTLRALIEAGLQAILRQQRPRRSFRLRDRSVGGKGLQPGVEEGSWAQVRDLVHRGRGA